MSDQPKIHIFAQFPPTEKGQIIPIAAEDEASAVLIAKSYLDGYALSVSSKYVEDDFTFYTARGKDYVYLGEARGPDDMGTLMALLAELGTQHAN